MSTMTFAKPCFQNEEERPMPRPFCKWQAEGHRDVALATETEQRGWCRSRPSFFVFSPQASLLEDRKWDLGVTPTGCVTLGMLLAFSGP